MVRLVPTQKLIVISFEFHNGSIKVTKDEHKDLLS